jgi:hypothetical protein
MSNCIEQNERVLAVGAAEVSVYAFHTGIILVRRQGSAELARIN